MRNNVYAGIHWRHQIDLGNGIITPGEAAVDIKLNGLNLPRDLTGRTVLDIGSWDGFFAFECEKRGAVDVLAIDEHIWLGKKENYSKAGFLYAREQLGSKVRDQTMSVYDISTDLGQFDLVLFLGVVYHLGHPFLAMERIAEVATDQIILESYCQDFGIDEPLCRFEMQAPGIYPNCQKPNVQYLHSLLEGVGFEITYSNIYADRRCTIHAQRLK